MPALGLGLSIYKSNNVLGSLAQKIAQALYDRVAADGGTFEAYDCMVANIQALLDIDLYPVGDAVMIALRDRAVADSGTFEAYNCGIIAVQSLANIDI